ncbi:hypothetical protein PHET_03890 [Paragonimus heterotremus]|uniref:Uncharacterized protein n=1 Tax=Paragonimus heterotremus TaxID=100268 RepID=A0A8J4T953_9TREM|nr:hypothetical protein PHET_03890 [Paragonimus heterotremus]
MVPRMWMNYHEPKTYGVVKSQDSMNPSDILTPPRVMLASVKQSLWHPKVPTVRRMDRDSSMQRLPEEHCRNSLLLTSEIEELMKENVRKNYEWIMHYKRKLFPLQLEVPKKEIDRQQKLLPMFTEASKPEYDLLTRTLLERQNVCPQDLKRVKPWHSPYFGGSISMTNPGLYRTKEIYPIGPPWRY